MPQLKTLDSDLPVIELALASWLREVRDEIKRGTLNGQALLIVENHIEHAERLHTRVKQSQPQ